MKNTKRALFSSVIALILCFSMLVGTTFAWFTDEVKSDVNKIVAGNLDVDVVTTADDKSIENQSVLFDEIKLWEPGVVAYENITVKNLGTLALKYQLSVNFNDANYVVEADGTETDNCLADVLMVSVIEGTIDAALSREEVLTKAGEGVLLSELVKSGKLESLKNQNYAIIIWWPQSANDDTFNINNGKTTTDGEALHINLGVKLFATQLDAEIEKDSFGPDYDEDAWHPEMQVATAADLQAALNNGETNITLIDDIETDESIIIPASAPAMRSVSNTVVIDLNGKTIKGTGLNAEGNRAHVIINNGNAVIKNGKIEVTGANGGSAICNNGTLTIDNMSIWGAPWGGDNTAWPSYAVNSYGDITINASKIVGTHGAVAVNEGSKGVINSGDISIIGCKLLSDHVLYAPGTSELTIKGGNFEMAYDNSVGGDTLFCGNFVVMGGIFNEDPSNYVAKTYEAVDNGDGTFSVIFPQESFDGLIDNAGEGATIDVPAGTYTFPASALKAGQTLNCAPGTVFNGKTGLNINGATVIGATFTNQNGYLVNSTTINGTFKDCVFTDCDGLRYCYAGETVVFENCVFDTDFYGVHFDGGANEVLFKNCTFTGFNTFGSAVTMLTMEGCTFKYNGNGGYNGINLWGDAKLTDCTFVFDGSAAYEWVDLVNNNKTVTFTNCVVTDGKTEKGVETVVGIYGEGNTVLVDGVYVVGTADTLKAALSSEAEDVEIVLANDVAIDIGCYWNMGGANTKSITIDGNGKTLTLSSTYRSYFNLANAEGVLNLKNMTLTNAHQGTHFFDYTTHFNCDVVAENVVFAKSPLVTGSATAVFNDCAFSQEGTDIYGLWIMSGTNVTVNGGELTTDRGFKIADEDSAKEMTTLKVSGTKFNNTKKAAILVTTNYGATITLENLDITNCAADSTNAVWIDDGRTETADQITVTGGSVIIEP